MILILSPAKKLDFSIDISTAGSTQPIFQERTEEIVKKMKKCSSSDLQNLMKISSTLAELNFSRFQDFNKAETKKSERPSLFVFQGDTYKGLDAATLSQKEITYLNKHLRILSGLYGVLRPQDLIRPYRLEMGTKVTIKEDVKLVDYWKPYVTSHLEKELVKQKNKVLINLASQEYFNVLDKSSFSGKIITPVFKEVKDNKAKIIGLFAKRARGMMARFLSLSQASDPEIMKTFTMEGYKFDKKTSNETDWIFLRKQ